jgi:serine/threonine-protein kinase
VSELLEVGSLLDGKYKILNEIGRGGMSVVYLALNERANKTWAVKEVRKDSVNDSEVIRLGLAAETKMLKKLRHPSLPGIVDVIDRDDSFIIVMDYIEGNSLQHLIDTEGAQDPERVIAWAKQLCDVLAYLHSRNPPIIYRDMKPANIMLRPDGTVTLIDFGTAREYKPARSEDTAWLGTRSYAAPEQFGGQGQTDGRTDIYNLGATMYHLVTGYSPADTDYNIYPVGKFIPRLQGSGLEKVIAACCRPAPADRFQSAGQLMYALEHVHDEDNETIRIRDRKWHAFICTSFIAAAALAAAVGFRILYSTSLGSIYDGMIADAMTATTLKEKISEYGAAIEIDPGRAEAWDSMIRSIQDRDHEVLYSGEVDEVRNCIKNGSSGSNLEQLKKSDRKAYARFNYNLGIILFFSSDNGRSGAFEYLKEAIVYKNRLSRTEAGITQLMYGLAQVDREKNRNTSDWAGGKGYRDYWDTLNNLLNGNESTLGRIAEECGGEGYPLAICNEVGSAVYQQLSRFKGQGVTRREMEEALRIAGTYLEDTFYTRDRSGYLFLKEDLDENMKKRADHARRMIADAVENVRNAFGDKDGTEEE